MARSLKAIAAVILAAALVLTADRTLREREVGERAEWREAYPDVRGFWSARRQELESGTVHELRGRLVLGERAWEVVYFVVDSAGRARRGTAEGGTYRPRGDTLLFTVEHTMMRGDSVPEVPATPFVMWVESRREAGVMEEGAAESSERGPESGGEDIAKDAGTSRDEGEAAAVPVRLEGDTLTLVYPGWGQLVFVREEGAVGGRRP